MDRTHKDISNQIVGTLEELAFIRYPELEKKFLEIRKTEWGIGVTALIAYLNEHKKTDIIFDFDETLVYLVVDWNRWSNKLEKLLNSYKSLSQAPKGNIAIVQNAYIKEFGSELRDRIVQISYEAERDDMKGYKLMKPQYDWIPELSRHFALYIWTSNDKRTVIPLMQKLGIDQYFKTVVTRPDVTYIKPDKEGFDIINADKKSIGSFIMIGDSSSDEGAAQNAGIDFLYVNTFTS